MISLGIDIGTTSICAVLYDLTEDKIIKSLSVPNSFINTGSYLQDPDRIVSLAKELLKELLMEFKAWAGEHEARNIRKPAGVGISSQMHGILYTDRTGRAVSPLYTWKNEDGNQRYRDGLTYARYLVKETELPFYTGYGSVTHFYLQENQQIPDEAVAFVGIGVGTVVMEQTAVLPAGGTAEPEAIPVFCAVGDNQASFLGAVKDKEHSVSINVGTGSQVSVYSGEWDPAAGTDIRPWIDHGYLYVGASLNGGKVYERLAAFFEEVCEEFAGQKVNAYETMERLAMEEQETELRAVPSLYGSREETDREPEAGIYGLNSGNFHPKDLIRSFTTGMARELFALYSAFPEKACAGKTQIVASGNGIRKNRLLREDVEKVFGLPVVFTDREEEAASGAALYVRQAVIEGGAECR